MSGLIAFGLLFGSVWGEVTAARPEHDPRPGVTETDDGLLLDWHAPPAQVEPQADGSIRFNLPGFEQTRQPGAPQLPFASVLIALPPDAQPAVQILSLDESVVLIPGRLAIAPQPAGVELDEAGQIIGGAFSSAPETHPAPNDPITLEDIGLVRGARLARVTFYPVRLDGARLRIATHVQARVAFGAVLRAPYPVNTDPVLNAIRATVVNPAHVHPAPSAQPATRITRQESLAQYVIEVGTSGITALTREALAAAGFPVNGADPAKLHLTRAGNEIAAEWDGDGDALFEAGEQILFYAEPRFSRYTATDTYILSLESTAGLRMGSRSAAPGASPAGNAGLTANAEVNTLYTPTCYCGELPAGRDGDRWIWDIVRRPDRAVLSYTLQLPNANTTRPGALSAYFIGYTDPPASPDHRVDVSLNGAPLGRIEWNGKLAVTATLPITPGILRSGANNVTLTLPGRPGVTIEGMWLDAFSIRYTRGSAAQGNAALFSGEAARRVYTVTLASTAQLRAYDVTDANQPQRLTGLSITANAVALRDPSSDLPRRYALAAGNGILSPVRIRPLLLLSGSHGADDLIISPGDFVPALDPLVSLRQSQGLAVVTETVQAIYDAYTGGRPDPAALRAYLTDAYQTWSPRPAYVLLVGDGTADPKQYVASTPPTIIPPYLAIVDPWAGESASDNQLVTVDGADNLPDMLIGRLPVNTLTETQVLVNKIVQYETQPAPGIWNRYILAATDNSDSAGNFPAHSDALLSAHVAAPFVTRRAYYTPPSTTVGAIQQAIRQGWSAGASILMYTGHASQSQWAAERLFHRDDVPGLSNGAKLPIVLEMTCFTSSFHNPAYSAIDEMLVRAPNGGAVAAWGPTGLGVSTGHSQLADGFLESALSDGQTDLGIAALSGKLSVAANSPFALDLIDTFTLLGDPATVLHLAVQINDVYLPVVRK